MRYLTLIILSCCLAAGCDGQRDASAEAVEVASLATPPAGGPEQRNENNDEISHSRRNAITAAVEKVSSAVVGINVTQIREARRGRYLEDPFFRFFFPERVPLRAVKSLGSGFLISPDGLVLTNEHVVHNATEIVVTLSDGTTANATVVGMDYVTDVALVKIDAKNLPNAELGNSDDVIIGEWAIALGNPFGLFEINAKPTVTVGVISAMDRDFGRQSNDRVYQDMIQTDAAINQGNSGGPLVNSEGEVIGMNTFIYTGSDYNTGSIGLGFAIPSNRIKRVLRDLEEYGEVNRRWTTGLVVEEITPLVARYFRLSSTDGVIVTDVEPGSPSDKAGIKVGDIITEVNGQRVQSDRDIWQVIDNSDLRGGDALQLKVFRGGRSMEFTLKLKRLTR